MCLNIKTRSTVLQDDNLQKDVHIKPFKCSIVYPLQYVRKVCLTMMYNNYVTLPYYSLFNSVNNACSLWVLIITFNLIFKLIKYDKIMLKAI